ncbi:FadR family transcriptional regulator [Cutibacterium sp. WCA-380-WT-3A]|uniref:FadR family transcriptional regulator n=1 Tax=Cutibacterium porci TaxID=2605781 RepID=A0A7K0J8F8_9ACTN|nr:FCD domain-containing protein [Cutibacterium porci]MSS46229.1 FadR family transcriptional regulator [Cutibacterium porci]
MINGMSDANDAVHLADNLNPAAQRMFEWILSSDLAPGDPIPIEQELASQFRMARGTVREAVRELRALGILEVRRGLGTYLSTASASTIRPSLVYRSVKQVTCDETGTKDFTGLREMVEVRALMECSLVTEVTGHIGDDTGRALHALAAQMDDPERSATADRQFHRLLYADMDNQLARELIDVFWDSLNLAGFMLPPANTMVATRQAHDLIADCVTGHDPQASRQAMWDHFAAIRERLAGTPHSSGRAPHTHPSA